MPKRRFNPTAARLAGTVVQLFMVWVFLALPLHAQRRDVIVMKNGDRLTGEVKRLEHGQLYVELEYVSGKTVALDWVEVEELSSTAHYVVSLNNGKRLSGSIGKSAEGSAEDFHIEEAGTTVRVASPQVVEIQPQKRNFWRQLKGSINIGQSYTSGNGQKALELGFDAKYLSTKYLIQTSFSSTLTGQAGAEDTRRYNVNLLGGRFLSRNNLILGLADLLHSSQQSLDLRTTVGSGYGRYFVRATRSELMAFGGLVFTNEQFDPNSALKPTSTQQNVEGLLGLHYSTYQFNKAQFETSAQLYPGISDAGRVRSRLESSLRYKLVHELNLQFTFWDNFDSKPPVDAKKNELGVSTTFGWSF